MTVTLGIEIGTASAMAVAVDGTGGVVARAAHAIDRREPARAAAAAACTVARQARVTGALAAGVAVYEPATSETAVLVEALSASLGGRVAVAALGIAAAVAEAWCGGGPGARDLVCLLVGERVAAGAIVGGVPWTGAHGLAGSAAWMALNPVERQDYHQHGCLDAEVSSRGIARRLAWRVEAGDLSRVVDCAGSLDAVTAQHVFDSARAGDGVAISIVRDTARYIGMALANLCVAFDPETIVLGGEIAAARDLLLEPVRLECLRRLPPALARHLRLVPSPLGDAAAAIGAARLAAPP